MLVWTSQAAAPTFPREKGDCIRVTTAPRLFTGRNTVLMVGFSSFLVFGSTQVCFYVFTHLSSVSSFWGPNMGGSRCPTGLWHKGLLSLLRYSNSRVSMVRGNLPQLVPIGFHQWRLPHPTERNLPCPYHLKTCVYWLLYSLICLRHIHYSHILVTLAKSICQSPPPSPSPLPSRN